MNITKVIFASVMMLFGGVASAVTVTLESIGTAQPRFGVYAGLYEISVDGGPTIAAMCDDVLTHINVGDTWDATLYTYADVMGGAPVKFSGTEKYSQAGFLFSLLSSVSLSDQADINLAIWNIMSPGSISMTPVAQAFYDTATNGFYDAFDWSLVMGVLTPNPLDVSQEDLIRVTPVPIPSAAMLFMSGLPFLGFTRSKRM